MSAGLACNLRHVEPSAGHASGAEQRAPTVASLLQQVVLEMQEVPHATWPEGQPAGVVKASVLLGRLGLLSALNATVVTV